MFQRAYCDNYVYQITADIAHLDYFNQLHSRTFPVGHFARYSGVLFSTPNLIGMHSIGTPAKCAAVITLTPRLAIPYSFKTVIGIQNMREIYKNNHSRYQLLRQTTPPGCRVQPPLNKNCTTLKVLKLYKQYIDNCLKKATTNVTSKAR
jgi:hypothetical protein